MPQPSLSLALYGTDIAPAASQPLIAGHWQCHFSEGGLRHIRWKGTEILRGIAFLLRDADWATPAATIDVTQLDMRPDGFRLRYDAEIRQGDIHLAYSTSIEADSDSLRLETAARPLSSFLTNRCGFVVLHPADVAGAALTVEHTDGRTETTTFSEHVSPGQPVFDIRRLTYERDCGVLVTTRLEARCPNDPHGRFEMEDQRNWSDASYKTYVGSLLDPWPYHLAPGDDIRQAVHVTVTDRRRPDGDPIQRDMARIAVGGLTGRFMPRFGLALADRPLSATASRCLAALDPRVVSLLVTSGAPETPHRLAEAANVVKSLGCDLQLELVLPGGQPVAAEIADTANLCAAAGLKPAAVVPCPAVYLKSYQPGGPWPEAPDLDLVYEATRQAFPGAAIGGGMLSYFTELNRKRPSGRHIDFISHTTAPIVHAADDLSVMETLQALPAIAASVRAIWPDHGYRIGPSTIAMRHNPYGEATVANAGWARMAMADRDPRQRGLFAAAWSIGYASAVEAAALDALILNATAGSSGVLADAGDGAWTSLNPFAVVHPAFHAMRLLCKASGRPTLATHCNHPSVAALGWRDDTTTHLLAANLTSEAVPVTLDADCQLRCLDAKEMKAASLDPAWFDSAPAERGRRILLGAYAIASITLA